MKMFTVVIFEVNKMNDKILKELVHIRCLLEGIYLDCKEAKEGTTLHNIEERVRDEIE